MKVKASEALNESAISKAIQKAKDSQLEVETYYWINKMEIAKFINDHRTEFREQARFCLEWYLEEDMD